MKARPRRDLSGNVLDNLIRVERRHAAADDLAVQFMVRTQCHGETGAYNSRAQCSSCVTNFARRDVWLGIRWRSASLLSCRFANLEDLDCADRWVRRQVVGFYNRGTSNRSVVRSVAEDVAN